MIKIKSAGRADAQQAGAAAAVLVSIGSSAAAAAVRRASKTMLARGIGGKVFAESKAQPINFVQVIQKKAPSAAFCRFSAW